MDVLLLLDRLVYLFQDGCYFGALSCYCIDAKHAIIVTNSILGAAAVAAAVAAG